MWFSNLFTCLRDLDAFASQQKSQKMDDIPGNIEENAANDNESLLPVKFRDHAMTENTKYVCMEE